MTVIRFYRDVLNHVELQSFVGQIQLGMHRGVLFFFFGYKRCELCNCEVQVRQENPRGFIIVVFHKEVTPLQISK